MKMIQWMMAAILICGTMVFTACSMEDNPAGGTGASGIAMIVKNGQIDYWRQIETAFRNACQEKNLEAYYYATTAENAYEEQLAAVEELRQFDGKKLKGIIFSPSYGLNGESAEAEVAALAQERGIPVIILDSPVGATSPLASAPYFGTDNTAAGQAMAEKVTSDKVAVFATTNSPGIERAEAFKALKPNAVVYQVGDKCNDEVQAVLDEYDTFVFFNGNCLVDAIPMLKAASKQAYTFDIYGEFLDELIDYSPMLKGIMAQNTFEMARKAVEAVVTNAKQGEMVPTFYITEDNLNNSDVVPFIEFFTLARKGQLLEVFDVQGSAGKARLTVGGKVIFTTDVFVGKNGLGKTGEGDGKTPLGTLRPLSAFGIKSNPGTTMPYIDVTPTTYACDEYCEFYNKIIDISVTGHECKGEEMYSYQPQYNYGIATDFNKACIYPKGSAIFIHVKGTKTYTGGCIAFDEDRMVEILKNCDMSLVITVKE